MNPREAITYIIYENSRTFIFFRDTNTVEDLPRETKRTHTFHKAKIDATPCHHFLPLGDSFGGTNTWRRENGRARTSKLL